jgi:Mrp family chromosome partitioning ATPase
MRVIIQSPLRKKLDTPGPVLVEQKRRSEPGACHEHHDELIRSLFSGPERKQVVAFISALRGEGVTHVCRSVASELAATRKSTVVVVSGWVLAEKEDSDDLGGLASQPLTGAPEVWVWPEERTGPAATVVQDRVPYEFNLVLEQLRREYDFVLLDCPAVEFGRAGTALAAKAQRTILVVEEGRAPRRAVAGAQRSLEIRGARLAGCVLNWGREL